MPGSNSNGLLAADTIADKEAGTVIVHGGYESRVWVDGKDKQLEAGAIGGHWEDKRTISTDHIAKRTGDWEGTADQEQHRHGGGTKSNCYGVDSCLRTLLEGRWLVSFKSANDEAWRQVA